MYNRNQVNLIGNIGSAPKTGSSSAGVPYATFSLATNDRWKDAEGKPQSHTEWHTVICWGKLAEIVGKYLSKGSYVTVEGSLRSREYTTDDGVKRRVWEVRASRVGFLERLEQLGDDESSRGNDSPADAAGQEIPF